MGKAVKERELLLLTIFVEGGMLLMGGIWISWRAIPVSFDLYLPHLLEGVLLASVLLALNLTLLNFIDYLGKAGRELREFLDLAALPLAQSLSPSGSFTVSLLAGLGEEVLFRGALQGEIGIVLSSALFALFHFGRSARFFPRVLCIYFLLSLTFGGLVLKTGSLIAAILAHTLYDLVLLSALRRYSQRPKSAPLHATDLRS